MKLHAEETTSLRLWEEAKEFEFGSNYDERTLKHIIQTIENNLIEVISMWDLTHLSLKQVRQKIKIAQQI